MKVFVLISATAEWESVKPLFPDARIQKSPYGEQFEANAGGWQVMFFHAGWGKVASAAALQYVIDHHAPDLIVNLGTCGGLAGVVQPEDVILVERAFIYDIVELMGDGDVTSYYASSLDLSWLRLPEHHTVRRGMIASADSDLPPEMVPVLKSRGVLAADWESAALAWVAKKNNVRLLILRAVSDIVSEQGGEAYSNMDVFTERARTIMRRLVEQLSDWLDTVRL